MLCTINVKPVPQTSLSIDDSMQPPGPAWK
jgi:hypothetical protein